MADLFSLTLIKVLYRIAKVFSRISKYPKVICLSEGFLFFGYFIFSFFIFLFLLFCVTVLIQLDVFALNT